MSYSKQKVQDTKNASNGNKLKRQEGTSWVCVFLGVLSFFLLNIIVGTFLFVVGVFSLFYTKFQQSQEKRDN